VQGCTWNWWGAFQTKGDTLRRTHKHIHWVKSDKAALNIAHPVKTQARCVEVYPTYNHKKPPDPRPTLASSLWKILAAMPDYEPIASPPPQWEFSHRAVDISHCAKGQPPRRMRLCRITPYRPAALAGKGTRHPAPLTGQIATC
jgi:hypothetical protein